MGRGPEQTFFHRGHKGLPGALVGKDLPIKARDMGSIAGPRSSHMSRGNYGHASQLLSLLSRACKLQLLKPVHWSLCSASTGIPCSVRLQKAYTHSREGSAQPKNEK